MLKAQEEQEAEEEEGELQATAEELEEERQDEAVRLLQGLYRARKARRTLREMVRANFVKEYNPETEYFQYRNKRTGEVTDHKPLDGREHHRPFDGREHHTHRVTRIQVVR